MRVFKIYIYTFKNIIYFTLGIGIRGLKSFSEPLDAGKRTSFLEPQPGVFRLGLFGVGIITRGSIITRK